MKKETLGFSVVEREGEHILVDANGVLVRFADKYDMTMWEAIEGFEKREALLMDILQKRDIATQKITDNGVEVVRELVDENEALKAEIKSLKGK